MAVNKRDRAQNTRLTSAASFFFTFAFIMAASFTHDCHIYRYYEGLEGNSLKLSVNLSVHHCVTCTCILNISTAYLQ